MANEQNESIRIEGCSVIYDMSSGLVITKVIPQAIKKAEKEGTVTSKNRWQLKEYLCTDYLSGR